MKIMIIGLINNTPNTTVGETLIINFIDGKSKWLSNVCTSNCINNKNTGYLGINK